MGENHHISGIDKRLVERIPTGGALRLDTKINICLLYTSDAADDVAGV